MDMTPDFKLAFDEYQRHVTLYGQDHPLAGLSSLLVIELAPIELRLEMAKQSLLDNLDYAPKENYSEDELLDYFYQNIANIGLTPDAVELKLNELRERK